jgi:hypothetical protein
MCPAATEPPPRSGGLWHSHMSSGPEHGPPALLGRALVPLRGLVMLGSYCPVLEGSRGDTWPTASCVTNTTGKRLLVLRSQPHTLPRQVHVLPRQTVIVDLQDMQTGCYGAVHAR